MVYVSVVMASEDTGGNRLTTFIKYLSSLLFQVLKANNWALVKYPFDTTMRWPEGQGELVRVYV